MRNVNIVSCLREELDIVIFPFSPEAWFGKDSFTMRCDPSKGD
jgi:hypothetical protein